MTTEPVLKEFCIHDSVRSLSLVNDSQADLLAHWSVMSRAAFGQHDQTLRDAEASGSRSDVPDGPAIGVWASSNGFHVQRARVGPTSTTTFSASTDRGSLVSPHLRSTIANFGVRGFITAFFSQPLIVRFEQTSKRTVFSTQ